MTDKSNPLVDTVAAVRAVKAHAEAASTGVLLVNLGTPAAPTAQAVRPYLKQFLSDPRVIEAPRLLWWFILRGYILPFRSPRSAKAYQSIWTENGSPLLVHNRALADRYAPICHG